MLSEKLKELTQENHLLLERKLVSEMKSIGHIKEYASLLSAFYSFFGGLERGIEKFIGVHDLPDCAQRRKSSSIAADMGSLGYSLPDLASAHELPEIRNKFQALGCLYVIEGSTLGGRMISKMILPRLPVDAQGAFTFFQGYGDQTMPMWLVFKDTLNDSLTPIKRNQESMLIEAANETFLKFSTWLDAHKLNAVIG